MAEPSATPWLPSGTTLADRISRRLRINRLTLAKYCFCYLGLIPVFVFTGLRLGHRTHVHPQLLTI
jgi:hypothetical protein